MSTGIDADTAGRPTTISNDPDGTIDGISMGPDAERQHGDAALAPTRETTFIVSRFVPHRVQRRGMEMRLVIDGPGALARDDAALHKVVARAHCWFEDLVEGRAASVQALAARLGVTPRYVQRVLPLALLAPKLVEKIAAGQQPATLTVNRLTDGTPLPIRWAEQVDSLRD